MACSAMLRYYYGLHVRAAAGPLWAGLTRLASGGGVAIKRMKRKQGGSLLLGCNASMSFQLGYF